MKIVSGKIHGSIFPRVRDDLVHKAYYIVDSGEFHNVIDNLSDAIDINVMNLQRDIRGTIKNSFGKEIIFETVGRRKHLKQMAHFLERE